MQINPTEHIYKMRVYFEDTDAGGVVFHANYLAFMERARSEWFIELGFSNPLCTQISDASSHDQNMCAFIVNKAELSFLKPARLYDELEIATKIVQLSQIGIVFAQVVRSAHDRELIFCTGQVSVISINTKLLPTQIRPLRMKHILLEKLCNGT